MAEEDFDFEAALAEKFTDAGLSTEEPDGEITQPEPEATDEPDVEAAPEEPPDDRPRDKQGRFAPREEPILGKFKSVDDLAAAYQQLEQRFGQTTQEREELNRLRQQVEALAVAEQRRAQAPSDWESLIDENPAQAAMLAYQQGNEHALRVASQAWDELAPGAPQLWWQNLQLQQRQAELEQRVQSQFQPVQDEQHTREFARAIAEIAAAHPDFDRYADQIAVVAENTPEVVGILQRGTYDAKRRVVESLYWMARGRASDNLAGAAQEAAQQQTEEARRGKLAASVASASTTPATPAGDAISRFKEAIVGTEIGI